MIAIKIAVIIMITEQFFSEIGTQNSSGLEKLDF